ncbi:MAG: hypothetical protein KDD67_05775 [Ignavibacteriae bacterium]|nr:hypothetical protein [Ignavibacteriota bacterium]MCB9217492.1 hypothetical protein [Ignavibacteria bacterium]
MLYRLSIGIVLLFASPVFLSAQDYSDAIHSAAEAIMQAMLERDYEALGSYTYPPMLEMLNGVAGPDKTGIDLIEEMMEQIWDGGGRIDSISVGQPTPHVVAGNQLHAVIPTFMSMHVMETQVNVESYMIAISSDSGVTWTFINSSSNIEAFLPILFPEWNDELQLPPNKEPEIIWESDDEVEPAGTFKAVVPEGEEW